MTALTFLPSRKQTLTTYLWVSPETQKQPSSHCPDMEHHHLESRTEEGCSHGMLSSPPLVMGEGSANGMADSGRDCQSYRVIWSLALGRFPKLSRPRATPLRDCVDEHTKKRHLEQTGLQPGVSAGNQDSSMGSTRKPEQKCSRFSQHTSSELPLGQPRPKSVLSQQQSHGPARLEPALQSTASTCPRPAPVVLPVPPIPTPPRKAAPGQRGTRGQEPGALALAAT